MSPPRRDSLSGKNRAPEPSSESRSPIITGDTTIKTTPRVIITLVSGCLAAAVMWIALKADVSAQGEKLKTHDGQLSELKSADAVITVKLQTAEERLLLIETWKKEMEQQRQDLKTMLDILHRIEAEQQTKKPLALVK